MSAGAAPPELAVQELPLVRLRPSPHNPRIFPAKPNAALVELAMSIRRHGLLQPVTARPIRSGGAPVLPGEEWGDDEVEIYEIVAGERRYRASCLGVEKGKLSKELLRQLEEAGPGRQDLKVIVRPLSDEEAMELCAIENLDREDLSPLEEANGIATLMTLYHGDVKAVAARIGKPVSWVAQRQRLTGLSAAWRKKLGMPEYENWTAAHLVEVAKLDVPGQDELLKAMYNPMSINVATVRSMVAAQTRRLGLAPFDIEDEALHPKAGSCMSCPSTSLSSPGLFADLDGEDALSSDIKVARCLNGTCWMAKQMAWARATHQKLVEEHGAGAKVGVSEYGDAHRLPEGLFSQAVVLGQRYCDYEEANAGSKGAFPVVHVTGDKTGQILWYRRKASASPHYAGQPKREGPRPLQERRELLDRRRQVLAVGKLVEILKGHMEPPTSKACDAVWLILALATAFGTRSNRSTLWEGYFDDEKAMKKPWKVFDRLVSSPTIEPAQKELWHQVQPVLLQRLTYTGSGCDMKQLMTDAVRVGDLIGVSTAELLAQAVAEIPEPKSWATLNEDGTPATAKGKERARGKKDATAGTAAADSSKGRGKGAKTDGKKVRPRKVAAKSTTTPATA